MWNYFVNFPIFLDYRKKRKRASSLVMSKKKRRMLPFNPSEDPTRRLEQMASLATALTATGTEFSNELTYMPGMAPRSANRAALEEEGMQVDWSDSALWWIFSIWFRQIQNRKACWCYNTNLISDQGFSSVVWKLLHCSFEEHFDAILMVICQLYSNNWDLLCEDLIAYWCIWADFSILLMQKHTYMYTLFLIVLGSYLRDICTKYYFVGWGIKFRNWLTNI